APGTDVARSAGARYQLTANNWTERLALNTSRPLFADLRLRRAVAGALDRTALARALNGGEFQLPTSGLLPPNLTGAGTARPPAPAGLAAARRLTSGRHLRAVFAAVAPEQGGIYDAGMVAALRAELGAIGIALTVVPLRQGASPAQQAGVLARAD